MRRLLRQIWQPLPVVCAVVCVLAVIIRLTVKDRILVASTLYYATPPAVIGALALLAGTIWCRRGRRGLGWSLIVAAVPCFVWHGVTNWRQAENAATPGPLRIVVWNTSHGSFGLDGLAADLRALDADVIAIVEAGWEIISAWKEAFPDYAVSRPGGEMLLLCRGKIEDERHKSIGFGSLYKTAKVEIGGASIRVFLVDLWSSPFKDRGAPLRSLADDARAANDGPVLIVGDFNTPGDSVHFNVLRPEFRNAFQTAGRGYTSTWPQPVPVIQIDHAWVNDPIDITSCYHGWSWHSDHRPVVLEISVRE